MDDDSNPFSVNAGNEAAVNPYAPTSNVSAAEPTPSEVEAYRRQYLSHEASVKSIGTLYMLGAIFMVPIGAITLITSLAGGVPNESERFIVAGVGLFYTAIGVLQGFTAVGLRRLQSWARIVAIVFSAIGLLAIPLGTLISGYFLYLLVGQKGQVVFSDQYQEVIKLTPHIVYKTPVIVWVLLILLLLLIVFVIFGIAIT